MGESRVRVFDFAVDLDTYVLVVGGSPEPSGAELLRALAADAQAVVAVDHGLDALLTAGVYCDLFCGDADSVGVRARGAVRAAERGDASRVGAVKRYDPHKDDTDLGLALRAVSSRWPATALVCSCLTGGRPDHALAALGRLSSWQGPHAYLVEDDFVARVLHAPASWDVCGYAGATFSFVPLSASAIVSESGMRWNLDHKEVPLLGDLGVSNVIEGQCATFVVHEGCAMAWVMAPSL